MHLSAPPAPAQQVCQAPALLLISPALLCIRELGPHAAQSAFALRNQVPAAARRAPDASSASGLDDSTVVLTNAIHLSRGATL